MLVQNSWQDVPFDELIRSQLGHFAHMIGDRIRISGPPTRIKAIAAQGFGLALHELATNAAKYGALSTESGSVAIAWSEIDGGDRRGLKLTWIESGGPEVVVPESSGFGSFMIEKSLASQFGCEVVLDYDPKGLRCKFFAPAERVLSG